MQWEKRGHEGELGLELGNDMDGMKSGGQRGLGWWCITCASWSKPGMGGRSGWVEHLDVVWEGPAL